MNDELHEIAEGLKDIDMHLQAILEELKKMWFERKVEKQLERMDNWRNPLRARDGRNE